MNNNIPRTLEKIVEKSGLEQDKFAETLGLKKAAFNNYIKGRRELPKKVITLLMEKYNVNPQIFFDENAPMYIRNIVNKENQLYNFESKKMVSSDKIESIISKNLKTLLKEFNINQNELAKIAGVSESAAGKWILGKSTPRMGAVQKIADHFNLPKSYILNEPSSDYLTEHFSLKLPLYGSVAAGALATVDGVTTSDVEFISVPKKFLGKYGECEGLFAMSVNGESMNKVIKNGSIVIVKAMDQYEYKDGDIVIFSYNNEYSLKRFSPNELEGFVLFRTESTDPAFKDIPIPKDTMNDLKIYGKVIFYGTTL